MIFRQRRRRRVRRRRWTQRGPRRRWTSALVLQIPAVTWLPQPLKLPRHQSHRGTPRRGRLRLLRFGFTDSCSDRWSCGSKVQWYVLFWMEKINPLFSCSVNLVVVGKSLVSPVIHEEHGYSSFPWLPSLVQWISLVMMCCHSLGCNVLSCDILLLSDRTTLQIHTWMITNFTNLPFD
jgi:hypothetical protein